jgi:transposase
MSKAQKIEALLEKGLSPIEVSKRLKVSRAYVYGINSRRNKRKAQKMEQQDTPARTRTGNPVKQSWWRSIVNAIFGTRL